MRTVALFIAITSALCTPFAPSAGMSSDATVSGGGPTGGPKLEPALPTAPGFVALKPDGWNGAPSDIAGTMVVDRGEYIVTDYVFDDRGGDVDGTPGLADHSDRLTFATLPETPLDGTRAALGAFGDYRYPQGVVEGSADIVEVRVAADASAWYVLIKFNALQDPATTMVEIAFGDHAIMAGGDVATFDGIPVSHAVNTELNVYEIGVPRSTFDPGFERYAVFVGAGLWDAEVGDWYQPNEFVRLRPFFDVAYVPGEDFSSYWSERRQSSDIAGGYFVGDSFQVDFATLVDEPCDGPLCIDLAHYGGLAVHLLRSGQMLGEGVVPAGDADGSSQLYRSAVQPYAIQAPLDHARRHPLVILLHPAGGNHLSYVLTAWPELADWAESIDAIIAMPFGRGETGVWTGVAEKDAFEVWRDVASHYPVDSRRVYLMGVGSGGLGAVRLGHLYPDQFARVLAWGAPLDTPTGSECDASAPGCSETIMDLFGNASNVPLLLAYGGLDIEVPVTESRDWIERLGESATPYAYVLEPDETDAPYQLAREHRMFDYWIGSLPARVDRPVEVRYRVSRAWLQPGSDEISSVYWLEGLNLANDRDEASVRARLGVVERSADPFGPTLADADGAPAVVSGVLFDDPLPTENYLRLEITGLERLIVSLDRIGWILEEPAHLIGQTLYPVAIVLRGAYASGVVVEGASYEQQGEDVVLHVPIGEFSVRLVRQGVST